MLGSFRIGSVFGITIRVHFLFVVLFAAVALSRPDEAWLLLPLVAVVFLHELGHSLVAQRFGIRVLDITFWPLGGMARMSEIPEDTKVESLIAIAGPAVNFVLAGIAAPIWIALAPSGGSLAGLVGWFMAMNLLLGTFNLLPAFPMDGGRVLRAVLGRKGDWVRATEKAVHVGRFVAVLMALVGLFGSSILPFTMLWPIIALWLWWAGGQELAAVRLRHAQDPFAGLRWFMNAAARAAGSRRAAPAGPAPEAAAQPEPVMRGPMTREKDSRVDGFTEEEIERLEQFRGSLRQYRAE